MSSSYTSFRGKGFWCRDGWLEVWLRLLALNLKGRAYDDGWEKDFRDRLLLMSSGLFGGMISIDLDEYLSDEQRVKYVLDAAVNLEGALEKLGPLIPGAFLSILTGEDIWGDLKTSYFLEVANCFISLLLGGEIRDLH